MLASNIIRTITGSFYFTLSSFIIRQCFTITTTICLNFSTSICSSIQTWEIRVFTRLFNWTQITNVFSCTNTFTIIIKFSSYKCTVILTIFIINITMCFSLTSNSLPIIKWGAITATIVLNLCACVQTTIKTFFICDITGSFSLTVNSLIKCLRAIAAAVIVYPCTFNYSIIKTSYIYLITRSFNFTIKSLIEIRSTLTLAILLKFCSNV